MAGRASSANFVSQRRQASNQLTYVRTHRDSATPEKTTPTAKSLFGGDAEVCTMRRAVFSPCARLWEANAVAVLTTSTSKNTYWWKAQQARDRRRRNRRGRTGHGSFF